MATISYETHLDLRQNRLIAAVVDPLATDPGTPLDGQVWTHTGEGRLKHRAGGVTKTLAFLDDVTAGSVTGALWDAQSVVVAITDDTPASLTIPEGAVLGRLSGGNIGAVTDVQLKALLGIPSGTIANQAFVTAEINALIDGADAARDTLAEIGAELDAGTTARAALTTAIDAKAGKHAETIGDGTATTITVTHALGTTDVVLSARAVVDDALVIVAWKPVSTTAVEIEFNNAPGAGAIRVVIVG